MKARVLLCPPDHYQVRYEINAWMDVRRPVSVARARFQWERLLSYLNRSCEVFMIPQSPSCPDQVFTANAGLVIGRDRILLSRFRHDERRAEERQYREWFVNNGFESLEVPEDVAFEGEGDVLAFQDKWLAGYRLRSDIHSHHFLSDLTGKEALSLELIDPRHYHLDTALFVLDEETIVYYPGAFDSYARRLIESLAETIHVLPHEARRFACNSVVMRDARTVLMPAGCPRLSHQLVRRGFKVNPIPMSEFIKSGGACKCLVLFLDAAAGGPEKRKSPRLPAIGRRRGHRASIRG